MNSSFTHRLAGRCFHYTELYLPLDPLPKNTENHSGMVYSFLAGGVVALMEYWLQIDCTEPPEQVAQDILELTQRVVSVEKV